MTLRLTEYKLIFKSSADCLGIFLAPAEQNEKQQHSKPCHVTHVVFDSRGLGHM